MRDEVIDICVEALRAQGERVDRDTIMTDPRLAALFLDLLRDCRPLPVITTLAREVEVARRAAAARPPGAAREHPDPLPDPLDGGTRCE
jgi:hypothetical protein